MNEKKSGGNQNRGGRNSGGGNNSGNNSGNQGGGNNSGAGRKRKKTRKKPRLDPVRYWGDAGALPVRTDYVLECKDPTAVIRSLGKAPIPGKNSAPELYFDVLYARAAGLAQALAFAGGLNESDRPSFADSAGTWSGSDADSDDDDEAEGS